MERKDTGIAVVYKLNPTEAERLKEKQPKLLEETPEIVVGPTRLGGTVFVYRYPELSPQEEHTFEALEQFAKEQEFPIKQLVVPSK